MKFKIQNRRYIGSKKSLVDYIYSLVKKEFGEEKIRFADFFAGTGVVSQFFAKEGHDIIINDLLYSNFCIYHAWFSKENINVNNIRRRIEELNNINFLNTYKKNNYFSKIYSDKYFSHNDAYIIGEMREKIENWKNDLEKREYYILVSALLYTVDKIANTVGHFEHFLSSKPLDKGVKIKELDILNFLGSIDIYNEDANILVNKCKADVVYLDPPYNSRQYVNFYHVLENLALWNKPTIFEGTSMKFKRDHLKSDYSKAKAPIVFEDLISKIDAQIIIVSYSNTYNARSSASNNKISEEEIFSILSKKGKVSRKEISYKGFNTGKTNFKNHKEYIYICKVEENNGKCIN